MPKLKLSDYEQKKHIARTTIQNRMKFKRIDNKNIAPRLHCAERTIRYRWQHPETLRLDDLWTLVSALGLNDEEILQIIKGKENV